MGLLGLNAIVRRLYRSSKLGQYNVSGMLCPKERNKIHLIMSLISSISMCFKIVKGSVVVSKQTISRARHTLEGLCGS